MTVLEFSTALHLTAFSKGDTGCAVTGCYCGDLLSWVMGRANPADAWITIMSSRNVAAVASLAELSCVILAEGVQPDSDLLDAAREKGITLLGSTASVYELAVRAGLVLR
ncbi:MAG: hypothetical protein RSB55_04150 [Oscillospiraceae bacterium]